VSFDKAAYWANKGKKQDKTINVFICKHCKRSDVTWVKAQGSGYNHADCPMRPAP
jgi:hypothetical protein